MNERDAGALRDMLDYARRAVRAAGGKPRDELEHDELLNLALQRLIEIVGEAANRVSAQCRQHYPQIPWDDIVGMRNRLIHGYDAVDTVILSQTIKEDLPRLIRDLELIVASLDTDTDC